MAGASGEQAAMPALGYKRVLLVTCIHLGHNLQPGNDTTGGEGMGIVASHLVKSSGKF